MKIHSVKIDNILSIEDAYIEFDDSGLMLVKGWNHDVGRANGAGKTAIFNAITFALFDKLPRKITATEILRRGCKNGSVTVVLSSGQHKYSVTRSRPKGALYSEIAENGTATPLTITQEGFESVIKLNYNQFVISMYASQGASTRFLSINDTEKKSFLLQLLNLEEFSLCKAAADRKVKSFEDELLVIQSRLNAIDSKIGAYSESLVDGSAISNSIVSATQNIVNLTYELSTVESILKPDFNKYQKLEEDISIKKTEFTKIRTKREMLHDQYRKLNSKIRPLVAKTECSECGFSLDTSAAVAAHNKSITSWKSDLSGIKIEIDQCDTLLLNESAVNSLHVKLIDKKRDESKDYEVASNRASNIQHQININQHDIKQLTLRLQNNSELLKKIKDLESLYTTGEISKANVLRNIELYKTVSSMYSPTGAQAYILDTVIESFNDRVQLYVNILWSNLSYELKSYRENVRGDVTAKFSEHLIMDGKEVSIGSLSGGEFRALSLCVDFALIGVMESQFGISLSPIILDEPFDGLDISGRDLIIDLLETISQTKQVIVVDHSSEVQSMFSKTLIVEKRSGVTTVNLQA